jgi:hypothetical protein
MLDRVLSARISEYAPANPVEQENVLQELMQHVIDHLKTYYFEHPPE